jgi:HK97 gp10 family phage protein
MTVRITIRQAELDAFLAERSDLSARAAATALRDRARSKAPKRTGEGARSIGYRQVATGPKGSAYVVGPTKKYMTYQEYGTGRISARPGGVLRFQAGGVFVFARHTKGVPARHFMRDAYAELREEDFRPGPNL